MKRVARARDIMNRGAVRLKAGTSLHDAAAALARRDQLHAPVLDEAGTLLGMFSQQGCMQALLDLTYEERPAGVVDAYLEPPAPSVGPAASLIDVAQAFVRAETPVPSLLVVEADRIVGTVSRLDMIRAILDYAAPGYDVRAATLYLSALRESDERPF